MSWGPHWTAARRRLRTTEYFKWNPGSTRALELVLTVSGGVVTKAVWEYAQ